MTVASASPAFLRETSIWSFELALQIRIPSFVNIAVGSHQSLQNPIVYTFLEMVLLNPSGHVFS